MLQGFWFGVIAVLWAGFFLLEGFDFGVGMLLPFVGQDETERGLALSLDRTGVGRQRGLAAGRRRRHVRRVPGVVRERVQRRSTWRSRCCSSG